jgi:large subunit ribosomal protein L21e
MTHSYGLRAHTRHLFAKGFRKHGMEHMSTYLRVYRVGDIVDIKANSAFHKGMPHKFYHGKTGVVYNVSKAAVGVIVNKRVGHRFMEKRINIRIEHVVPSKCRDDLIARIKDNSAKLASRKSGDSKISLKRSPVMPRSAHVVNPRNTITETVTPVPYVALV